MITSSDVGDLREERRQAGIDYRNLVKEYGEQQKRKRFVNAKQKEQAKKDAMEKHERELYVIRRIIQVVDKHVDLVLLYNILDGFLRWLTIKA